MFIFFTGFNGFQWLFSAENLFLYIQIILLNFGHVRLPFLSNWVINEVIEALFKKQQKSLWGLLVTFAVLRN